MGVKQDTLNSEAEEVFGMWKFIEDLKKDFKQGLDDLADEKESSEVREKTQNEALSLGQKAIQGDTIVALEDGTVEMINQDQDEIEIYFDNGHGYGIKFPFGPTGYTVKVSPNEKVHKGQVLVTFGPDLNHNVKVYSFTPDMIKVLTESRFRIR